MRISRDWLSDYVDLSKLSDAELENLVTTKIAEVDAVHRVGIYAESAKVVLINKVEPHPNSDKLRLVNISLGKKDEVQVVCGAPNCREGALAAYLPVGQKCLNRKTGEEIKVEKREVAGIPSSGMLVSEAELAIGSDAEGLLILPENSAVPGEELIKVVGKADSIFEIDNKSVTHRADLWGHLGFARELAAVLDKDLKLKPDNWSDATPEGIKSWKQLKKGKAGYTVKVNENSGCRRFSAICLSGAKAIQSPFWMRRRLYSVGAGVRNFLVDLSNYVMHDVGQPNHTYDASKLSGSSIFIRRAKKGETFIGLDDIERKLDAEDIVIADEKGVVALGGVIGGKESAISEDTTEIVLESANFDPVDIRKSTKRHQLRTDASNRFEKNRTPFSVPLGTQRYIELLTKEIPEVQVSGGVSDDFPEKPTLVSIPLDYDYIRSRLGPEVSKDKINGILSSLGFVISGAKVLVPYYRASKDVAIIDDLVEEVGRIYGYEQIAEKAPLIASIASAVDVNKDLEEGTRGLLSSLGFSEVYNYSFMNPKKASQLGISSNNAVELLNPIDATQSYLRNSLVPGMLEFLEKNARHVNRVALFELGRTYLQAKKKSKRDPEVSEQRKLSIGFLSDAKDSLKNVGIPELASGGHFFSMAAVLRRLACHLGVSDLRLSSIEKDSAESCSWMHPYRTARVCRTDTSETLGVLAEVSPIVGLSVRAIVAELNLEAFYEAGRELATEKFAPISRYPDSFFEMSIVMPDRCPYLELERLLRDNVDKQLLRQIEVIAVYRGKPLKDSEKSISVKMFFGAQDRTLSTDELANTQNRLINSVDASPFSLRS